MSTDTPPGDRYEQAVWLIERHPDLSRLVDRVPGVATWDPEAEAWEYNLALLAFALTETDRAGSRLDTPLVKAVSVMSCSEKARLRLLASLGHARVPMRAGDLDSLDYDGRRLLADWCRAVLA